MSQDYAERAERPQTLWQKVKGLPLLSEVGGLAVGVVVFLVLYVEDVHENAALVLAFAAASAVSFVLLVACVIYDVKKDSRRAIASHDAEHDAIGG